MRQEMSARIIGVDGLAIDIRMIADGRAELNRAEYRLLELYPESEVKIRIA